MLSTPEGFVYDMRAISEIHHGHDGEAVDVVTEEDYYRWMFVHEAPKPVAYPARLVWVE